MAAFQPSPKGLWRTRKAGLRTLLTNQSSRVRIKFTVKPEPEEKYVAHLDSSWQKQN
jgi:hypothetical protein